MPPSRRTTVAMQRDWTDGVPAQAGGVVGARGAHVTTPSASHPPLLEKEGSKAGPVILLGALTDYGDVKPGRVLVRVIPCDSVAILETGSSHQSRFRQSMSEELPKEKNVLGGPLLACRYDPGTGYFRDGCWATAGAG